jgi:hypothetical protein
MEMLLKYAMFIIEQKDMLLPYYEKFNQKLEGTIKEYVL